MTKLTEIAKAAYEANLSFVTLVPSLRTGGWEELSPSDRVRWIGVARAALEALREPSDKMLDAACDVGPDTPNGEFDYDDSRRVWQAVIDSILSEETGK